MWPAWARRLWARQRLALWSAAILVLTLFVVGVLLLATLEAWRSPTTASFSPLLGAARGHERSLDPG